MVIPYIGELDNRSVDAFLIYQSNVYLSPYIGEQYILSPIADCDIAVPSINAVYDLYSFMYSDALAAVFKIFLSANFCFLYCSVYLKAINRYSGFFLIHILQHNIYDVVIILGIA